MTGLWPRFREPRILREQVALIYRNYPTGFIGLLCISCITAYVLRVTTNPPGLWLWVIASACVDLLPVIRARFFRRKEASPEREAMRQTIELSIAGITWGLCPLLFLDGGHPVVMIVIICFTAGLVAAALAFQSACLPVYLGFAIPSVLAAAVGLFHLGGDVYWGFGVAAVLYLLSMMMFASNLETLVKTSIELRDENVELIQDLREAIDKTKEADRAKSVFLASASHDLRQPMHAISLLVETMARTSLGAYQQDVLAHIRAATGASREMLDGFLDFSKIEAGVIVPSPSSFHLQPLLDRLERELLPMASEKDLVYRSRETTAAVHTDPGLLELILRNLIVNAIRYTERGGVLVGCRRKVDGRVTVEVWDSGIGIPVDQHADIFREFHQIGNPERDRKKGFGLGLAIVQRLSRTLGLPLDMRSRPGAGSVFRLTLPRAEGAIVEDRMDVPSSLRFDGLRAMIIDDDDDVRLAMSGLLQSLGFQCLACASVDEALAMLGDRAPDLLIADYRLRGKRTGRDAIERVRHRAGGDIPAIIVTGDTAADRLKDARDCDAFLMHKPVSVMRLISTMAQAVHAH